MKPNSSDTELIQHLANVSGLPTSQLQHLIAEIVSYYSEPLEEYVRKRHHQLQSAGYSNALAFTRIQQEVQERRFPAAKLSERQLRRMVYG